MKYDRIGGYQAALIHERVMLAQLAAVDAEKRRVAAILQSEPRIGLLIDGSFYAFANGYDKPEVRSSNIDEIVEMLA